MGYKFWTQQEIDFLEENYGKEHIRDLSKKLGKTKTSIRMKAKKMQLKGMCFLWSKKEITILKRGYKQEKSIQELCRELPKRKSHSIIMMAHKLGFSSKYKRLPNSIYKLNSNLAYVLGVMLGDGTYCYDIFNKPSGVRLNVKDKDFALNFKEKLERIIKREVRITKFPSCPNLWSVYFHSTELANLIKNYRENINQIMLNAPKECQIAFLEGLYDSEGHVHYNFIRKGKKEIGFSNTTKNTIKLVYSLLKKYKIRSQISHRKQKKELYIISITHRHYLTIFHQLIHFSIARKQDRLNQMICSYSRKKPYSLIGQKIINTGDTFI